MRKKQSRRKSTKHKYGYSLREKTTHENFSVYTEIKQLKFHYSPVHKQENKTKIYSNQYLTQTQTIWETKHENINAKNSPLNNL